MEFLLDANLPDTFNLWRGAQHMKTIGPTWDDPDI